MSCNVIKEYTLFSSKCIKKYFKEIMGKYFDDDVFSPFLERYIEVRYYNLFNNDKGLVFNIDKSLEDVYKVSNEKKDVAKFVLEIFKIIYYFDDVYKKSDNDKLINDLNEIRIKKLGLNDKDFVVNFRNLLLGDKERKIKFLNSFDNKDFEVKKKKIFNSSIYDISLIYHFDVPKLYSNYAIDKVFNTGIIGEDKLFVEYYLINVILLRDIIMGKFNKCYLLEFNSSLFSKKDKIRRLLNIYDNDISKELISLKIDYDKFSEFRDEICTLMREGYKFSVIISNDVKKMDVDNGKLDIFEYILVDKERADLDIFNEYDNVILIS